MSTLLLHHAGQTRAVPLATSTLVGRASACLARVHEASLPLYWLEVRWRSSRWMWRTLAGDDRTRGPASVADDGWREFDLARGRATRVHFGDLVTIELVEAGPPQPFLVDVVTGEYVRGEALAEWVEVRGEALFPPDAEGEPERALAEGACFVHGGRAWCAYGIGTLEPTARARVDLARDGATLAVDLHLLRATLLQGGAAIEIVGEPVRVLAAYHAARTEALDGGWMDAMAAWSAWRSLGGSLESPSERIAWERGRVRSAFARAGVASPERLFEVARDRHGTRVRLAVRPAR